MKPIKKLLNLVSSARLQDIRSAYSSTVALKIWPRGWQPLHQCHGGLVRNADTSASPQTHRRRGAGDGAGERSPWARSG